MAEGSRTTDGDQPPVEFVRDDDVCDISNVRVSVIRAPAHVAFSVMSDAIGDRRRGLPDHVRRRVLELAPASAKGVVRPIVATPRTLPLPTVVAPWDLTRDTTIDEIADCIEGTAGDHLEAQVHDTYGAIPSCWQPAARQPDEWGHRYAATLRSVASSMRVFEKQAGRLLERETERIGSATVRGALAPLLNGLHPYVRFVDRPVDDARARPEPTITVKQLVLVPMVAGPGSGFDLLDHDTLAIGYALPGLGNVWGDGAARPLSDDLTGRVLGSTRAEILRFLSSPQPVSAIAAHLPVAASTASAHCDWLVEAGLAERDRRGKYIYVHRTVRGSQLIEILRP